MYLEFKYLRDHQFEIQNHVKPNNPQFIKYLYFNHIFQGEVEHLVENR